MGEALDYADELLTQERYADFLRANRKFHDLIAAQSQNSVLQEVLANLGAKSGASARSSSRGIRNGRTTSAARIARSWKLWLAAT